MTKLFSILFSFLLSLGIGSGQDIKVLTYNIRYDSPNDGENRWALRKEFLTNQLKFYEPDVFGIQEGLKHQVDYLDSSLVNYRYIGAGRDDGKIKGEYSAIYFRSNKFELAEQSTFWLSETPEKPSVGWDAAMERICTYALLQENVTKRYFWVFNTHFDHIGELARANSAKLIIAEIERRNVQNYPVVQMGDLNLEPTHKSIKYLSNQMNDSRQTATVVFGPEGTFNGFNWSQSITRRIDYIFTSKANIVVRKYAVLTDSNDRKYPSDHFPVYVELSINK